MSDKIVEIEWEDAYHNAGWTWKSRARKEDGIARCRTVGYLLKSNFREVTVYQSSSDSDNIDSTMSIPKKCIKNLRYLG